MKYRGLTKSEVEAVKQSLKGLPFTVKHEYFGGIQINPKSTAVMTVALAKSVVERLEKIEFLFLGLLEDSFRIFLSMSDTQELTRQFFRSIYAK